MSYLYLSLATAAAAEDQLRFGTVGRPLPGVEIKVADDGELLIRGPNVFHEYWRNPEATREAFTEDGWLRTGDLGSIDDDCFVSITGRTKDIIITAGGKNLTPTNLENDLRQSRWISQAIMYGIKKFELLDHDLSQAAGEMTPTQKVKRSVINARYADLFERMYDQGERA